MSRTENSPVKVMLMRQSTEEPFKGHDIPARSKLYGLVPCGLGTRWQESLTSYLNRLAWRHHIPPRHLAAQELLPRLSQSDSRHQLGGCSWGGALGINGHNATAHEWATILEDLTKRSALHWLTLRWWVGDLAPHKLLREKPAWCPAWYAEWKDQKKPVYEPLLWTFQVVTMCMKHHRMREEHCPNCQKRQPIIRFQATLGQCTHCKTWLGSMTLDPPSPEPIEWQEWVISAFDELRRTIVSTGALFWDQFFTNISQSFEAKGEQSRLAGLAGLARGQLATWLRRSHTATVQSILEFCYVCNVTPLQVLTGNLSPLKRIIQEGKPYRPPRTRRLVRPRDREYCLERIQAILDGKEEPLAYVQLAQPLGYSSQVLLDHFPQACALLSEQIKEQRRQRKEQRIARVQEEGRQAPLAIHAQGIYPSQNKVADLLSDPNLLFQPEAKATWRALCQELGWDRKNESGL